MKNKKKKWAVIPLDIFPRTYAYEAGWQYFTDFNFIIIVFWYPLYTSTASFVQSVKNVFLNKFPIANLLDCLQAFSALNITAMTEQWADQWRERALGSDVGPNPK